LIQSRDRNFNGVDHTAWKLDWAATAVALAAPIVTCIAIRRHSNKAHDAAGGACQEPDVREAAEEIDASAASDRET